MKKILVMGSFLCMVLGGCAGGGTTQAAPAVTHTVTETATATVTATATATATVTVTEPAAVLAPVASAAAVPVPDVPETAVIPVNVAGLNAEALDDDLSALGFHKIIYNSDTGRTVLLLRNWTVTAIDAPGTEQSVDKAVVVHVTK
jgi:hypothetical protein